MDDFRPEVLTEVIGQNWENARYFESARWRYIYFYYAAIGACLAFFLSDISDENLGMVEMLFPIAHLCESQASSLLVGGIMLVFLGLVGMASFFHLLHSNIEYKNFVRANEWIARDLGINVGIEKYRKATRFRDKLKVDHSAYLALPLGLMIRNKMPFQILTPLAVGLSFWFGFHCGMVAVIHLASLDEYVHWPVLYTIPIVIGLAVVVWLRRTSTKQTQRAEDALTVRDPKKRSIATEFKPGDVFLTQGHGLLSAAIRFFSRTIGESRTKVNHVGMVVEEGDLRTCVVVEALLHVCEHPLWEQYGPPSRDAVAIYRPLNLTQTETRTSLTRPWNRSGRGTGSSSWSRTCWTGACSVHTCSGGLPGTGSIRSAHGWLRMLSQRPARISGSSPGRLSRMTSGTLWWTIPKNTSAFIHWRASGPMRKRVMSKRIRNSELQVIPGVGPSIAGNLEELGITTLADLRMQDPEKLYARLNTLCGVRQDPCVLYVFRCAVYFASTDNPAPDLLKWWNWKDKQLGDS